MMKQTVLALLLLAFSISAQQIYISGSFKSLNPTQRTNLACYNHAKKQWNKEYTYDQVYSKSAVISETETFFILDGTNYQQLMYQKGSTMQPVNGAQGLFYYQPASNGSFSAPAITKIMVNAARTRLWVFGTFSSIGETGSTKLIDGGTTFALFDISGSYISPKLIPVQPPATFFTSIYSVDTIFTQGEDLLFIGTSGLYTKLYRLTVSNSAYTGISDNAQSGYVTGAIYKQSPDETLFMYSPRGLLTQATTDPNPTYGYLDVGATTMYAVLTTYKVTPDTITANFHNTKWTPTNDHEIYFIHSSTSLSAPSTPELVDTMDKLMRYVYKAKQGVQPVQITTDRLSSSSTTYGTLTSLITDLKYDAYTKNIMLSGSFNYIVKGAYQSPNQLVVENRIPQDKRYYQIVYTTTNRVMMSSTDGSFSPFLGGGGPYISSSLMDLSSYLYIPTIPCTCFQTATTGSTVVYGYNTFSPTVASYSSGAWRPVPNLSGQFDVDQFGSAPSVNAFARIGDALGNDTFICGYFRTINNVTYNSVAKYAKSATGVMTPTTLGTGLLKYTWLTEQGTLSNIYNFREYTRYYNITPGSASRMVYDQSSKQLFVSGIFTKAGNLMVTNFARWYDVNSTWSDVAGGVDGTISKMVLFNGNLVVAGAGITRAGPYKVNRIAMFNIATNSWQPMGQGLSSFSDMIVFNNMLIVSGDVNGRRKFVGPDTISVYIPSSNTFTPLPTVKYPSDSSSCYGGTPSCNTAISTFYIANGKLYGATNSYVFLFNGKQFEYLSNVVPTPMMTALLTALEPNTRMVVFNKRVVHLDPADAMSSWQYNYDREDQNLVDADIDVINSAPAKQLSILMLAAMFALLTLIL